MSEAYYRFAPSVGWLTHLWKSVTRQDHASWRPILRRLLPADGVAIDVGAHGGQFTRLLADLAPRGLVVAVEPSGYTQSVLRLALWVRGVRNVAVVATALGAESGAALLNTPIKRQGDMGYGLANIATTASATGITELVSVTTLDALVGALALKRLDFVKADIEGHEAALIAGAQKTLKRFRPALLLEQDPNFLARAGASLETLWTELMTLGYQPHTLSSTGDAPAPIEDVPRQGDVLWLPTR
jgi:FkbM family methyltransferase